MAWRLFVTVAHIHSVESRENLLLTTQFVEDVFERFGAVGGVFGGTSARFLGDHFDHRGKAQIWGFVLFFITVSFCAFLETFRAIFLNFDGRDKVVNHMT